MGPIVGPVLSATQEESEAYLRRSEAQFRAKV